MFLPLSISIFTVANIPLFINISLLGFDLLFDLSNFSSEFYEDFYPGGYYFES